VALGNTQIYGDSYWETFAPVMDYSSLRILLALSVQEGLYISQMDCSNAYIQGDADCEIYLRPPPGFVKRDAEGRPMALKLKKSIYGLKQSGHIWHRTLVEHLLSMGYRQLITDKCVLMKTWVDKDGKPQKTLLGMYVDDLIVCSSDPEAKDDVLRGLRERFEVKDETEDGCGWILNMRFDVSQNRDRLTLTQTAAIEALVRKFGLDKDNTLEKYEIPMIPSIKMQPHKGEPVSRESFDYRSAVGSCLYLALSTRPDIAYTVMCLSRHTRDPDFHTARFLGFEGASAPPPSSRGAGWKSDQAENFEPVTDANFVDADFGGSYDGRSTSGYCFQLCGGAVKWSSKLQQLVALSTAESEIYAATEATKDR